MVQENVSATSFEFVTDISGEMGVSVYSFQERNLSRSFNLRPLKYVKHNTSDMVELWFEEKFLKIVGFACYHYHCLNFFRTATKSRNVFSVCWWEVWWILYFKFCKSCVVGSLRQLPFQFITCHSLWTIGSIYPTLYYIMHEYFACTLVWIHGSYTATDPTWLLFFLQKKMNHLSHGTYWKLHLVQS